MRKIALLMLALGVASPLAARAQYASPGQGVGPSTQAFAKLGAVIPKDDDLEGFDNGFALEAGVGFRLSENVGIDVAIGRFAMGFSDSGFDPVYGTVSVDVELSAIPITGSLKLIAPASGVDLYGLVGAGLYFTELSLDATSSVYGSAAESYDDTVFGIHFGAGLAARLSPQVSLGAELKYIVGEATFLDVPLSFNSLVFAASLGFQF